MCDCKPLKCLEEVLTWSEADDWAKLVLPITTRTKFCYSGSDFRCCGNVYKKVKTLASGTVKTLVCHDMKGGYLNDRFIDGTASSNEYVFSQWSAIDIFIYFSHYLVTIPPLMWINAAHKHGVKILGTLITEFKEGEQIWDEIFKTQDILDTFVNKLISICNHYNFDGYLINIENNINTDNLNQLVQFLTRLKHGLKDTCLVIWYDSVSLVDGKLSWQNELNKHNKDTFMICDGIFLNYTWKDENLRISSLRAGARQHDVFVGVDVFGRGCFGGGGFDTDKAVAVVRSYGLSLALFGVGWTHEVETNRCIPEQFDDKKYNFQEIERKFWSKLWPYLYVSGPAYIPFKTTFCQGYGYNLFENGIVMNNLPWYNLSSQCHQSSITFCLNDETVSSCISYIDEDGFMNGGCIVFKKTQIEPVIYNLLVCDFKCMKDSPILLSITSKWPLIYEPYKISLVVEGINNHHGTINMVVYNPAFTTTLFEYECVEDYSSLSNVSQLISHSECGNEWLLSKFLITFDGNITEIKLLMNQDILIGLLSIEYKNSIIETTSISN